ncbi:MAG: hypothetical protein L0H84_24080, partial [Pseudonocardia sp.]|nr:hypothetical protein [Pseudonocardia sp.]
MPVSPPRPPMGRLTPQDRPHVGTRRRGTHAGAASYARALVPVVGMSIIVVVLIAGITAWVSSAQARNTA